MLSESDRYYLMKALEENPNASQRQLATELGYSLGKVNYCLKALVERGWVKAENFSKSPNKAGYFYLLTPKGLKAKAIIARRFLQEKLLEHQKLVEQINQLQEEIWLRKR